jgi:hypothetical protein
LQLSFAAGKAEGVDGGAADGEGIAGFMRIELGATAGLSGRSSRRTSLGLGATTRGGSDAGGVAFGGAADGGARASTLANAADEGALAATAVGSGTGVPRLKTA